MRFVVIAAAVMFTLLFVAAVMLSFGLRGAAVVAGTLAAVPIAAMLYRLRCNNKTAYGIFELIIATGFLYYLTLGMLEKAPDVMTVELITNRMLTLFAAVYFIVRALDNIGQGLSGTRGERWKRFFES